MTHGATAIVAIAAMLIGCSGGGSCPDDSCSADAGSALDSAVDGGPASPDSGATDAGSMRDAGMVDARIRDGGGDIDAESSPGCAPGTVWVETECSPCSSGSYCAGGDSPELPCDDGSWDSDADPATECVSRTSCPSGQRVEDDGSSTADRTCVDCPDGETSVGPNAPSCTDPGQGTVFESLPRGGYPGCAVRASDQAGICWGRLDVLPPRSERFSEISAKCGIRASDGTPVCWEDFDNSLYRPVPTTTPVRDLWLGWNHACAIRIADSHPECWGLDAFNESSGLPDVPVDAVSAHESVSCAIRTDDKSVVCVGRDAHGRVSEAPSGTFREVAVGRYHACAIRTDGSVTCWGRDNGGSTTDMPLGPHHGLRADSQVACALRDADDRAVCWGYDGTLSNGTVTAVPDLPFEEISLRRQAACGLLSDGTIRCWGADTFSPTVTGSPQSEAYGDLLEATGGTFCGVRRADSHLRCDGYGYFLPYMSPVEGTPIADVTLYDEGCAIRSVDHQLHCWGHNDFGVLDVPEGVEFDRVDTEFHFACGIVRPTGSIRCWGTEYSGEVSGVPTGAFDDLTLGSGFGCAIRRTDGGVECWGASPAPVPSGSFSMLEAGTDHVCGLDAVARTVTCWGDDDYGSVSAAPAGIAMDDLSVHWDTACVIRASDQRATCWGQYPGVGVAIPDEGFTAIASAGSLACAVRAVDDTLTCWGDYYWNPR